MDGAIRKVWLKNFLWAQDAQIMEEIKDLSGLSRTESSVVVIQTITQHIAWRCAKISLRMGKGSNRSPATLWFTHTHRGSTSVSFLGFLCGRACISVKEQCKPLQKVRQILAPTSRVGAWASFMWGLSGLLSDTEQKTFRGCKILMPKTTS
jgi:hypothetical protein